MHNFTHALCSAAVLLGVLSEAFSGHGLGAVRSAHADEGESSFSTGVAVSGFSIPDHNPLGGLIGFDYEYSVTEAVWLKLSAGGGTYYDDGNPAYAGYSHVGISYLIDVLQYVPYIDLGVGVLAVAADDVEEPILPLIEIGVGMDFLTSKERSYGVFARFESFLGRSAFYSVGVRRSWRWGFF